MNISSIAYTFYETDYRVRRYAESLVGPGNRVDVIALQNNDKKTHSILNGVNIYHIQKRSFDEAGPLSYLVKILRFFAKGSLILLLKHLKYRYKVIHIHNVPDFLVFMALIPKLLGAKIILDIHDILPEFYCQKFGKEFKNVFCIGDCTRKLAKEKGCVHIPGCPPTKRQMVNLFNGIPLTPSYGLFV